MSLRGWHFGGIPNRRVVLDAFQRGNDTQSIAIMCGCEESHVYNMLASFDDGGDALETPKRFD